MLNHDELGRSQDPYLRFAEILEATADFVATADLEGRTLFINRAGRHMVGIGEEDDVYGIPIGNKYADWARKVVLEHGIPAAMRDGVWSGETAFHLPDGREIPISQQIIAHRDDSGEVEYLSTIARDISGLKESEEALRQTEQQYQSIFENTTDAILVVDYEGAIVEVNPAACTMHGYGREELVGMHGTDIVHPEDHHKIVGFVEQVGAGRKFELEGVHVHKNGRAIDVEVTGTSFVFRGGPHLLVVVRNITEHKKHEEELKESRVQLEVILGGISDGISAHGPDGRLVYMNDEHARILGYSSAREFLQKPFEERFQEGFRRGALMDEEGRPIKDPDQLPGARALRGEKPPEQILRYRQPDGEERWLISRATPIFDEGDQVWLTITIVRDVTESRKAEAEIRNQARQQEVVADLGQSALAGKALSPLMDEAVEALGRTLEVEYCKVLELLPDGEGLLLRAGVGWREGMVGHATAGAHLDTQAGYTLVMEEPVVSEDLNSDTRFSGPPLLQGHGVVSGMSTVIRGYAKPYGVLGVHTTRHRKFSTDEVNFLRAVANVLAEAIERKRSEEELNRQAELIDLAHDAVIVRDPAGTVSYWNRGAEQIYGWTREGATGRVVHELLHTSFPISREAVEATLADDRRWEGELSHTRRDGTVIEVESRQVVTGAGNGRKVLEVNRDITERKRAERTLIEMRDAERRRIARELHDGVLQDLAHAALEMEILRAIVDDQESGTRLQRTIDALRRGGRGLRAAVYALRVEEEYNMPLHQLLGSLVEQNRRMAQNQKIALELQEGLPSTPLGELGKELVQIVREALTNARRHSEAGRVLVSARPENNTLLIEISDDGQGFGSNVTSGMGTESMRERASTIGGKLTVESQPGEGTIVRLRVSLSSLQRSDVRISRS